MTWHTNYSYYRDCTRPGTIDVATNDVMNGLPDLSKVNPPSDKVCSRNGGGGDYLSNESGYRNTVLRDAFNLNIPAGHIHTPVMNNFFTGTAKWTPAAKKLNDNAITDGSYEAYRTAIVAQTKALLIEVGNTLAKAEKKQ